MAFKQFFLGNTDPNSNLLPLLNSGKNFKVWHSLKIMLIKTHCGNAFPVQFILTHISDMPWETIKRNSQNIKL